ncbi:cytochrome P450 [Suillus placidus]|uniref:Cytochrome P450 n=1 Tax=Suillus placidus TaxID=48579 RepID=A0A9P6ZKK2_9AGAM|nr:cytochrome P450 [Suillus placidus]
MLCIPSTSLQRPSHASSAAPILSTPFHNHHTIATILHQTPKTVVEDANTPPVTAHIRVQVDDACTRAQVYAACGRGTDPPSLAVDAAPPSPSYPPLHPGFELVAKRILYGSFGHKALGALDALVLAGNVLRAKIRSRPRLPLPPGPPGYWLFCNPLPKVNQSQQFAEWINTYGPIISFRVGPGKVMVIINRHQESRDIMEKEMVWQHTLIFKRKLQNPMRQSRWTPPVMLSLTSLVTLKDTRQLRIGVWFFLTYSITLNASNASCAASVILCVMYGKSAPTATNAPEIIVIHKMLKRFQMLMRPGAFLIERYPILKYVPGCTTEELATGKSGSSFARYRLENQSSHKLSDEEMAYLAASLFGVGSDTTAVAIMYVVMASACYPKAQEKVQEQLDIVVDRERAPMFDDYNSLPQIEAFMLECLRWRPVTTLGFAHCASADVVYKGMCITEGAIVFGNHWAISRDPSVYPNPDKFDPEKWLNSEGKFRDDLKFPSYGFGRRYDLA